MFKSVQPRVLLFAAVGILMIRSSCREEPESVGPVLPPFDDPISYDLLGQGKLVFARIGPPEDAYNGFYVVDIDQQRCWNIDCGLTFAPSVSPEGARIAYTKWGTDQTSNDIYIMDIDGSHPVDVTGVTGDEYTPSWTFDGAQILYSLDLFYDNSHNTEALYRQSPLPDPVDRTQILNYSTIDPPNFILGRGLVSSSSAGKLLVLQAGLRTFDADGSNMKLILPFDPASDHRIYSPVWSPDGSKMALLSYKMNSDIAVVLINPDGTDPDTLVSLPVTGTMDWLGQDNQISLCWSPDGSKIAFTRPDGMYVGSHIFIIGVDHTGLAKITSETGVTDFSLSWGH
jgi:dipeptidyl aminopeptidase/acylaminoacyl peptidase